MNSERRRAIRNAVKTMEELYQSLDDFYGKMFELKDELYDLKEQEWEYFDKMPESLQRTERGSEAMLAVKLLQEAHDSILVFLECDELSSQEQFDVQLRVMKPVLEEVRALKRICGSR